MQFGLFLLPANKEIARVGSEATGYDLLNKSSSKPCSGINPRWQKFSSQYGFHLTVHGMMETMTPVAEIINAYENMQWTNIGLISALATEIVLTPTTVPEVRMNIQLNKKLKKIHNRCLYVGRPFVSGSLYSRWVQDKPNWYSSLSKTQKQHLQVYKNPNVLTDYRPHITLLDPVPVVDSQKAVDRAKELLALPLMLEFAAMAFVIRDKPNDHCRVETIFPLSHDY